MSGTTTFPTGFPGLTAARTDVVLADDGAQNGTLTIAQVVGQLLLTDLPAGGATTGQVLGYNSGSWGPVAAGGYTLPQATPTTLGGVIVGANIAVASGTVSLAASPSITGSLTVAGKIVAGGTAALVTIGADTISGSVVIGVPGASTPYLDFQGAGVMSGYSARFIANASNTVRLISQTGTATLAVTGSLAATSLTLTGSQSQSTVFAAPSGGAGAPSFRALMASDVPGVVPNTVTVAAGVALTGGGALSSNVTLNLANTAVTAGSYGDASHVSAITVDAQGRLTAAASTAIAVDATAIATGTLVIARGGTGASVLGSALTVNTGTLNVVTATTSVQGIAAIGSGITLNSGTIGIAASVAGLSSALDATIPAGTYDLGPFIQGGTVLNSYAHVASGGTITLTGAIGAPGTYTAITGLTSLAVSTTADSIGTATAANVIAAGAHLWLIVANTSTPLGGSVFFSVKVP